MWIQWLPWRFIVRYVARAQGFLDPIKVFSQLQRFSQPSEIATPIELLRLGTVLQARGLMNAQAIQHNLDWIWPFWVHRQFNPRDPAFIPRAFSATQINLTHRNWTALGIPGSSDYPLVDPRGLLTPFYDSWSLDVWLLTKNRKNLAPAMAGHVVQEMVFEPGLGMRTVTTEQGLELKLHSWVERSKKTGNPVLCMRAEAEADCKGWLAVSLRPFNPEGVSFVHKIEVRNGKSGWKIDGKKNVYFNHSWDVHNFSQYQEGDVYRKLPVPSPETSVSCPVGMASAAALFEVYPGIKKEVCVRVPLGKDLDEDFQDGSHETSVLWQESLRLVSSLEIPEKRFSFLYQAAARTLVLHSPKEIYPGPFTYKHFWFRDAVIICYAMLCAGMTQRVGELIPLFFERQTVSGYFRSQEGEWDSNGQVLWLLEKFCRMTGKSPDPEWKKPILKAIHWIQRKLEPEKPESLHSGLFPAGFSAEHLGPNDFYYWDDFWGAEGLRSGAWLLEKLGEKNAAAAVEDEASRFLNNIERSLDKVAKRLKTSAMPASPYRRLDTGAVGSITAGYPLQVWAPRDERVLATANYLIENCFVEGGFFHDIAHSGINQYLTLHIAQVLLRAGDPRYFEMLKSLAALATAAGQWPEAIHPQTRGGCMGDGQHVWAAAEWMVMMRNLFVREEGRKLVIGAGITQDWIEEGSSLSWGPAPTEFGNLKVEINFREPELRIFLDTQWHGEAPEMELQLAGVPVSRLKPGENLFTLRKAKA